MKRRLKYVILPFFSLKKKRKGTKLSDFKIGGHLANE